MPTVIGYYIFLCRIQTCAFKYPAEEIKNERDIVSLRGVLLPVLHSITLLSS